MNFFLANLAVSDLLVLLICLPPTVVNDITKTFWFSSTVCKAIVFFQVCYQQFSSINHYIEYKKNFFLWFDDHTDPIANHFIPL